MRVESRPAGGGAAGRVHIGVGLLVLIALGGCGAEGGAGGGRVIRPPVAGDTVPAFTGALLQGDSLSLRDLETPALVNLWATWCPPCRHEIPFLQELAERFGPDGLRVVGISSDDAGARDQVRGLASELGVTYDIVLDPRGTTMDLFRVVGLPATYLVDGDGVIRWSRTGPVSAADTTLLDAIAALVGTR